MVFNVLDRQLTLNCYDYENERSRYDLPC